MNLALRPRSLTAGWFLATLFLGSAIGQEVTVPPNTVPGRLVVHGGSEDSGPTPLTIALKKPAHPNIYVLQRAGDGRRLPAEIFEESGTSYFSTVLDRVSKGHDDTYEMAIRTTEAARGLPPGVALKADGIRTRATIGKDLFAVLNPDFEGPKPFLFPLIGPTGTRLTRAYPMEDVAGEDRDHPHQRSFWFTHGKVNGIDFWSETPGHGHIRQRSLVVQAFDHGSVANVRTRNVWQGPDGKEICEDQRTFRFYCLASPRILDFEITIHAHRGPVTFGDTKEGTFGLRLASSMDVKRKTGGKITNAEGLNDLEAWGKASPWVDYTGPVEGRTVGVAILNHPESFRYPTTWHVRDYGLFAANPFGWHDFGLGKSGDYTIPDGGSIRFRYRLILHEGPTDAARLPAAFRAFAEPPAITIGERR